MVPSDLTIAYRPNYPDAGAERQDAVFPAFMAYKADAAAGRRRRASAWIRPTCRPLKFLAADADGDGVADAGLVYLTTVDGIALLLRHAHHRQQLGRSTSTPPARCAGISRRSGARSNRPSMLRLPSSVGLLEMLLDSAGRLAATPARPRWTRSTATCGTSRPARCCAPVTPVQDPINPNAPDDATPTPRTDFDLRHAGRSGLLPVSTPAARTPASARRRAAPDAGPDARVQPVPAVDLNLSLMYRFGMMNPTSLDPTLANSVDGVLDTALNTNDPIYRAAPNYAAAAPPASLDARFRSCRRTSGVLVPVQLQLRQQRRPSDRPDLLHRLSRRRCPELPMRSLLTTHNPVSNRTVGQAQAINSSMLPYGNKGAGTTSRLTTSATSATTRAGRAAGAAQRTYLYIATAASGPQHHAAADRRGRRPGVGAGQPAGSGGNAGAGVRDRRHRPAQHRRRRRWAIPNWGLYVSSPAAREPRRRHARRPVA